MRTKHDSSFDKADIAKPQPSMHTDIPRLKAGNVGAQFWSVYVPTEASRQGAALQQTLEQIELVHEMVKRYPETFELARTVADIERIRQAGKIASLIGVEGGHSIEDSITNLRKLRELGAAYMTLTHSDTLAWADSATDAGKHQGLSPFGEEVVREMNKLGMLVDLSHVSDETMKDAIRISTAPVIFSHSSARAVADHPRNVPDDVLALVKKNGGVVMINFFPGFITPEGARTMREVLQVTRDLRQKFPKEDDFRRERKRWEDRHPYPAGSIHDVVDHIDHVAKTAGIDHVGLGSDFDGITKVPEQLEDVSTYPAITQELLNRGYKPEDIHKIMSGNILRVMKRAEEVAAR
jgi:membrane dipeptidase